MNNDLNMYIIMITICAVIVGWAFFGLAFWLTRTADKIKQLPPIQSERIKAKWLPIGIADAVGGESAMWGDEIAYHACDNCWQQALEKDGEEVLSDFCPYCGADMKGEDNETD